MTMTLDLAQLAKLSASALWNTLREATERASQNGSWRRWLWRGALVAYLAASLAHTAGALPAIAVTMLNAAEAFALLLSMISG